MSEPTHDRELAALETALTGLTPAVPGIDRDQLMFRAGQAAAQQRGRPWLWSTAALTVLATGLGAALALQPTLWPVERIVYVAVQQSVPAPAVEEPGAVDVTAARRYYEIQEQLLTRGLDGLPNLPPVPAESSEALRQKLGL